MRTIQVLGKAYSETGQAVSVSCNIAGMGEVFNGTVPTVDASPETHNGEMEVLFSFDVDETLSNTVIASDITATNGAVFVAFIAANKLNPVNFSEFVTLIRATPDLKQDVRLDGVLLDPVEPEDGWHYEIPDGSTLSIDWQLRELPYGVPGRPVVGAGKLIAGVEYEITVSGTTDWISVGAPNNNVGTVFTATGNEPSQGGGKAVPTALQA